MNLRPTWIHLDESALLNNISLLKKWNGDGFFCPMVKANAYGHGAIVIAKWLEKARVSALGVALYDEAIRLRQAGVKKTPILVFAPVDRAAAEAAREFNLTPVIGRFEDLAPLKSGKVHLKFNTGMNRLGFDQSELPRLKKLLSGSQLEIEATCTHLTHGEDLADKNGPTRAQLKRLAAFNKEFKAKFSHAHKSATLATCALKKIKKPDNFGARPGIAMYGLEHETGLLGPGLKPVMSWHTRVVRVHELKKGEAVSYGGRWVAPRRSVIGVVPVGYGDGYMRALSNRGEMLFRNQRVPVVGSVCMDYTLLDLTRVLKDGMVQSGEEVTIFGRQGDEHLRAEELAEKVGTIVYEVVTGIRGRVREGYDPSLETKSQSDQRRV